MMPAEWEPHNACYMAWPCRPETWFGYYAEAKAGYAQAAHAIARFEPVIMLAPAGLVQEASESIGPGIEVQEMDIDDSWVRDNGPIFVRREDGRIAAVKFRFNGYGNKFLPYDKDAKVPERLAEGLGMVRYDAPIVLEGGAISVDGQGTLLTTEQCLRNPNRNPELSREEIEGILADYLGARRVIWLGRGLEGDVTDGHVDGIACFARPGLVLAAYSDDPSDPNHAALAENLARLETSTDAKGRSLEIVKLPQPRYVDLHGRAVITSYLNHYIANGGVVVPIYDLPEDGKALETLRSVYPGREVVGVPGTYLQVGGGAVHCITQQQPGSAPRGARQGHGGKLKGPRRNRRA